jgi:hypothetical protein
MGAVITFPEPRRARREPALREHGLRAAVIILPVIRIERDIGANARALTQPSKSPPGRKRRRRASRT